MPNFAASKTNINKESSMKTKQLVAGLLLGLSSLTLSNYSLLAQSKKTSKTALETKPSKQIIERVSTQDGLSLHLVKDIPATEARAVVVISHGLASHSGVFARFAERLNKEGVAVYRFDHRAHGKSAGRDSLHIKSYFEMADDLGLIIRKAKAELPSLPVFVLGHSMGGHIAALTGTREPGLADGYIMAAGVLRYNFMNFGSLPRAERPDSFVAGEKAVLQTALPMDFSSPEFSLPNDPLALSRFSVSFLNSFKEGIQYLRDKDDLFTDPVLLLSGDADIYVVPQDAIDFYRETNSQDKTMHLYHGIGHSLFLLDNGAFITDDIVRWIKARSTK